MKKQTEEDLLAKFKARYTCLDGQFCACGLPATHLENGVYLCYRHKKPPVARSRTRDFSGKSATPYGKYEDR